MDVLEQIFDGLVALFARHAATRAAFTSKAQGKPQTAFFVDVILDGIGRLFEEILHEPKAALALGRRTGEGIGRVEQGMEICQGRVEFRIKGDVQAGFFLHKQDRLFGWLRLRIAQQQPDPWPAKSGSFCPINLTAGPFWQRYKGGLP